MRRRSCQRGGQGNRLSADRLAHANQTTLEEARTLQELADTVPLTLAFIDPLVSGINNLACLPGNTF